MYEISLGLTTELNMLFTPPLLFYSHTYTSRKKTNNLNKHGLVIFQVIRKLVNYYMFHVVVVLVGKVLLTMLKTAIKQAVE